jgi:hypothetical protein
MSVKVSEEQVLFAKIMNKGMLLGLLSLAITFLFYCLDITDPLIPKEQITNYWVLPVNEYLAQSGIEAGWAWLGNIHYSDMLNFLPIAFLSLLTIICYISIIPSFIKKRDIAFTTIAVLEIIVLVVAASGILGTGGH